MSASGALKTLAAAATAAAVALDAEPRVDSTPVKPGLRLPGGDRVYDYCRKLFGNHVAAWLDDCKLEKMDIVELEMVEHRNDEEYYLIHWPGSFTCAIMWASHGGVGNCAWRYQEFKADYTIEKFMREHNAWTETRPG